MVGWCRGIAQVDNAFIQNEQILVASVTDPVGGALKPRYEAPGGPQVRLSKTQWLLIATDSMLAAQICPGAAR